MIIGCYDFATMMPPVWILDQWNSCKPAYCLAIIIREFGTGQTRPGRTNK